jgi:hypothetical protein
MGKEINSLTPEDFFIKEIDGDASFIDVRLKISKENRNEIIGVLMKSVYKSVDLIEGVQVAKMYFSNVDIEQEFKNKKKELIEQLTESINNINF